MKLIETIKNLYKIDDESVLYVKRIDGQFTFESETIMLMLTDEELEWKPMEVTKRKCPEYEYFMEVFLINEIIEDMKNNESLKAKCNRIIHYKEFDA